MSGLGKTVGILCFVVVCFGAGAARSEESVGDKIKKIFAPTPTPPPRKHRKSTAKSKAETKAQAVPAASATPRKPGSSKRKTAAESDGSKKRSEETESVPRKKRK